MPIILDDLLDDITAKAALVAATPKVFSSKLTGSGKKTGLLSMFLRPSTVPTLQPEDLNGRPVEKKFHTSSGDIVTNYIPIDPFLQHSLCNGQATTLAVPPRDDMYCIDQAKNLWLAMSVQAMVLREDQTPGRTSRELSIQYRIELYTLNDTTSDRAWVQGPNMPGAAASTNRVQLNWSYKPLVTIPNLVRSGFGITVDVAELTEWLDEYDVYEYVSRSAESWVTEGIADLMETHINEIATSQPSDTVLERLSLQMRFLETYPVTLDAYRRLYSAIKAAFAADPNLGTHLTKQNLNLLMNGTLDHLDQIRPTLSRPPQTGSIAGGHFSMQQKTAISTDEPLVMVQAGAGTGKSTVILARIEYLVSAGVRPEDVTVLSFTNAAADNITAKNPDVGSMTIARMIHDIYTENFDKHELSALDTIINSLDIFYPNNDLALRFRRHLFAVKKNDTGSFTGLNSFVEAHFDEVMTILDTIKQTSLELEIIVCYQKINDLKEPAHVLSQYLIIDEVQDNSIFEFIFLLEYVAKHAENLFIVGDPSQTLYEFRSSNPKALNTLETSGVFATYKLTTNYRSNQEVLDFANVSLADIQANLAGIRLMANSLAPVTEASFAEKVTLNYRWTNTQKEFNEGLAGIIRIEIKEWIDAALMRGEQVAFLAYSRRDAGVAEAQLKQMYPDRTVTNLIPPKVYPTTVFSEFIKRYWNDIRQLDPANAAYAVSREMLKALPQLTRNPVAAEPQVRSMLSDWWLSSAESIDGTRAGVANSGGTGGWVAAYRQNMITKDEFYHRLRENLLDYEIQHNAVKQSMTSQRNKQEKERLLAEGSDLLVSTIHSAKGLEFDNVIVLHRFDSQMDEADKRMYYVAFTRAKNTLYVLSNGTLKNPKIVSDYEMILKILHDRDIAAAQAAMGIDPDLVQDIDEDDDVFATVA